ncbi:hypothetical protein LEP1GSC043_1650 [Leptospira weilii str. Ecochallenge]|uniref:Uncharacterized protein n=1 Tax=Leptospira weilii str. Ecochallenge TaxID=1049986 RepID=N1U3R1_9LEPT|nr:hypothetical protein LEP1GSC043_1650 [Leptospira weilii str. Ecochallenge]
MGFALKLTVFYFIGISKNFITNKTFDDGYSFTNIKKT